MRNELSLGETLPQLSNGPGPLKTVRGLGAITVDAGIVAELSPVPLPEGYCFAEPDTIKSPEVARLYRQVEQNDATPDDFLEQRDTVLWSELLDVVNIGVRTVAGELSGFGSLAYYRTEGELCDLVVDPRHQRRGIAKALIAARLAIAERAGITDLYSPPLAPTNTLRTYYFELGFRETEAGELVFR